MRIICAHEAPGLPRRLAGLTLDDAERIRDNSAAAEQLSGRHKFVIEPYETAAAPFPVM